VNDTFVVVVNPAAGGGRCRKLVGPALERLRAGGLKLEIVETARPGDAAQLARKYYERGYRRFIAVGGDGTSYEIVNGLFPRQGVGIPRSWAFFRSGRAIPFCAISTREAWKAPWKRFWRSVRAPAT
jgi:predicted polyphosphate/ATP-dependent NAD kinase